MMITLLRMSSLPINESTATSQTGALIIVVVVVLVVNVIFKKQGLLKNVQDIMQTIM